MTVASATPLSRGYAMTESARWHEGRLWFVDMHQHKVFALDAAGKAEVMATLPCPAGGLGWLPDGRLLAVAMDKRQILRKDPGGWAVHVDLSSEVPSRLNDMWVDRAGRAYVGEMGFDAHDWFHANPKIAADWFAGKTQVCDVPVRGRLFVVNPDGSWKVAAQELVFPNGTVVDEAAQWLIVAETFAARLAVFRILPDGLLERTGTWELGFYPDGIGLDGRGGVWVTDPVKKQVRRIKYGGGETDRVTTDLTTISCAVGGSDGQTLFICNCPITEPEKALAGMGSRVDVAAIPKG